MGIVRHALESLALDEGIQPRETCDADHWRGMADWLREHTGDDLPPLEVVEEGRWLWVWDGFHRVLAYRDAGRLEAPCIVRRGTKREAILLSLGANEHHGLKRTAEDKQRAVRTMLDDAEWGKWSDRAIADACLVGHAMVSRLRSELAGGP